MPENLNRISTFTLPPIPFNVSVVSMEHDTKRKAKISWFMRIPHNRCEDKIDYVIEARAHVGYSFSKHKLGQWFAINTENVHLESMHSHNSKCVFYMSNSQVNVCSEMFSFFFRSACNLELPVWSRLKLDDFMNFVFWR